VSQESTKAQCGNQGRIASNPARTASNPADDASRLNFNTPWLVGARKPDVVLPDQLSQWGIKDLQPYGSGQILFSLVKRPGESHLA